jgi:hypothetical protein
MMFGRFATLAALAFLLAACDINEPINPTNCTDPRVITYQAIRNGGMSPIIKTVSLCVLHERKLAKPHD